MESNIHDLNSPRFLIDIHHKVHGYLQTYDYDGLVSYLTPYDDNTTNPNILKTILIAAKHDFIYKTSAGNIITKLENRFDEIMHPTKYDIECPYCQMGQNINHDDGYGYKGNRTYDQQCSHCDKYFVFTTSITFHYDVEKVDCLNGGEHSYKPTNTFPKEFSEMRCTMCDIRRRLTDEERTQYSIPKI